jgi:hypothetical protein
LELLSAGSRDNRHHTIAAAPIDGDPRLPPGRIGPQQVRQLAPAESGLHADPAIVPGDLVQPERTQGGEPRYGEAGPIRG